MLTTGVGLLSAEEHPGIAEADLLHPLALLSVLFAFSAAALV